MKSSQSLIPLPVAIVLAVVIAIAGAVAAIVVASQSFIERYVLLLATAGIAGFFVPYVLKVIDDRKMREQKKYEDELSRQNKVIDAQVQFLESISKLLWEFHALIARVSYYNKKMGQGNDTAYINKSSEATSVYEDKLWDILIIGIQSEMSKASRLVSAQAHQKLEALYKDILIKRDQEVVGLIEGNASHKDWDEFYDEKLKEGLVKEIEDTLHMLAKDMGLTRQGSKSTP